MKRLALCFCLITTFALQAQKLEILTNTTAKALLEDTGYQGTIIVFDLDTQTYSASHPSLADERFIPASTFKLLSTQAALQSGVVENKDSILKWDGIQRGRKETNRDLDLTTAFRISSVPHYQALIREMGDERMQAFVDSVPYGNQNIAGGIDQFWLTGELRISPREQIEFLVSLYQNQLPFDQETMDSVKSMMISPSETKTEYVAKTGWAILPPNNNFGWWVGWAKQGGRVLFFATLLESNAPRDDFGKTRIEVTKKVIEQTFSK